MSGVDVLAPVIILLLVGIIGILLTRQIGQSPVIGYLLAGMLIGPHALGLIEESATIHLLAELGVVFLLFDIGLHFTLTSIWEARRDILGLGPLQIVSCGLAFGGAAIAFGMELEYALILGGAIALSSTAVVVHTIAERGQQNCPVGLTGTAVLIFQDICAIFLLIFAASLGEAGPLASGISLGATIALAVGKAVVAFVAAMLIGRYAITPLFKLLAQTRNEEVFTAMALLVVLATAVTTGSAGLSLTLGAFLGGMMISETPYRHLVQTEAKPFRNLLLGFFFITIGMSLDWHILLGHGSEILAFLLALIVAKALLVSAAALVMGWSIPGSVQLGFLLAQGSEFIFVIIAMPTVRSALGENTSGVIITGVAVSLALTPALAKFGNRLARVLERKFVVAMAAHETVPKVSLAPVVVFGLGEIGRSVADALEAHNVAYDAIEGDYETFLTAGADGYPVAFGDMSDVRLMETLAYAKRDAVVITKMSRPPSPHIHQRYPDVPCFVAVETKGAKLQLESLGLRPVIDRSIPPGLDLAVEILRYLRIDEESIKTWMQRQQERALEANRNIEDQRGFARRVISDTHTGKEFT